MRITRQGRWVAAAALLTILGLAGCGPATPATPAAAGPAAGAAGAAGPAAGAAEEDDTAAPTGEVVEGLELVADTQPTCTSYDPMRLGLGTHGGLWFLVGPTVPTPVSLTSESDAVDAFALMRRYRMVCSFGPTQRTEFLYWTQPTGELGTLNKVDCLPYDPTTLHIYQDVKTNGYLLSDGRSRMHGFASLGDAALGIKYARRHHAHCFIGRPRTTTNWPIEYWV